MAFRQSRQILAGYPTIHARGAGEALILTADILQPAGGFLVNDVIEMVGLGEGYVPTSVEVVSEDLDSNGTPLVTLDIGVLSGPYSKQLNADNSARTCGNEGAAASTVGQAGGKIDCTKAAIYNLVPSLDIVSLGFKVVAAPATPVVGARLRMNVTAHPMPVAV
jgi:hypothetical protein